MNKIREYAQSLTDVQRVAILTDWNRFDQHGAIGECTLRDHARVCLGVDHPITVPSVTLMRDLAFECYRHYANLYFEFQSSQMDGPI